MQKPALDISAILKENPLVLAPLAGWTDLSFRLVTKPFGPGLVYTEMISAEGLIRKEPKTWSLLKSHPAENPLVVQIFGSDPERLALAGKMVEDSGYKILDVNMGCSVTKIVKQGSGSALTRNPKMAGRVFRAMRKACSIVLTAKIRTGWSKTEGITAVEVAKMAEQEGLNALAIHPRYSRQGFTGSADWTLIERLAHEVKIPVIGSGDIKTPQLALEMLKTGCQGIMIGRAAVGNPWIFSQTLNLLSGKDIEPVNIDLRRNTIKRHLALLQHYEGDHQTWLKFKGLSGSYLKGLSGIKKIRQEIHMSMDHKHISRLLDEYFESLSELTAGEYQAI